jgi:hypothetical protein
MTGRGSEADQPPLRDAVRSFCRDHADLATVAGREDRPADPAAWAALAISGCSGCLEFAVT